MPSLRRILGACLVAVLLAAQQAALEHPLRHVGTTDEKSPLCSQHDALGTVLGAIGCAAAPLAPVPQEFAALAAPNLPARDNAPLVSSSRDPPALL